MTELVTRLAPRGIDHEPDKSTLEMAHVSVVFGEGTNGTTLSQGTHHALRDIGFAVNRGERVAIVGPNGAGKTTLFRVIVGTISPSSGQVHVYGHGPGDHICIAYVPQRNQIDLSFPATVKDVVMMGRVGRIGLFRWPRGRDWDIVHTSLERVEAGHLAKRQIGELSGGQQQRIFIARALAQEAELLLMDEPLTGLDLPSQERIFHILDSLQADGVTVLVATHDLNLAAERFDRVMLLNHEIIAFDRPELALRAENLLTAYGGQARLIGGEKELVLVDGCCGHGEEVGDF